MNSKELYRSATILLVATALTACANYGGNSSSKDSGYGNSAYGKTTKTTTEEASKTVTVTISNFAFEPAAMSINAGDTIVFVNQDGAPHTATSDTGAFDTGQLSTGQSGSVTISEAGEYAYFCSIHPSMKASITVQ